MKHSPPSDVVAGAERPSPAVDGDAKVRGTHMLAVGRSRDLHAAAARLGVRLSAVMPMSRIEGADRSLYERIYAVPDAAHRDEWLRTAAAIHALDPVDAVAGFSEVVQHHAASIAQELGLPFHRAEVITATSDKAVMRQVLRAHGLDATASERVGGAEDVARFAARHGYPVVLKPVDGRGSCGIAVVRGPADIPDALTWYGRRAADHDMLAEQFLEGDEYSVEAFSERGRHHVICVTQKFNDPTTKVEVGHCLPAPIEEHERCAIERYVTEVLSALGVEDGPSHTEVIVTPDGPRIVETHVRPAGDSIIDMIGLLSGVDLCELWVRQCAGESIAAKLPRRLSGHAAIAYATPQARGKLCAVEGAAESEAMPGVQSVDILQEPGWECEELLESYSRGASAVAVADSSSDAIARARSAVSQLRFVVSCGG